MFRVGEADQALFLLGMSSWPFTSPTFNYQPAQDHSKPLSPCTSVNPPSSVAPPSSQPVEPDAVSHLKQFGLCPLMWINNLRNEGEEPASSKHYKGETTLGYERFQKPRNWGASH